MATDITPLPEAGGSRLPARLAPLDRLRALMRPRRRQALAAILGVAAFGNFYQLQQNGFGNLYYAAAIRSMLESWHNFFFVSFDPGGFVTVDKPPLGFWIQAGSARLLGYSGLSILLPEALAGVASVGVLYLLVRRIFGAPAGLLAALFLAITPVSVVTNRNNTIDSLLVLTVLLGAYAISRAAEEGSLRWLLIAAVLVGLGFNIKMLEAYLIVPAFAAVYLLGSPERWWKRLIHLLVAGVTLLAVSLAWVLAVDLTPASTRPYVGSSGTNSELELALGYNGLQRLLGHFVNFSNLGSAVAIATAPGGPGGASENGPAGLFRLLNAQLGGQASWLLALGLVGIAASGWGAVRVGSQVRRGAPAGTVIPPGVARGSTGRWRLSRAQSALLLWGLWTFTQVVFFSVAGFFHRYYLSMLAPGIAALAGIGVVLLWRDYRSTGWRGWLLPAALVLTSLTQAIILADYSGWNAWLTPLIVGGSLIIAGLLIGYRLLESRIISPPWSWTRPSESVAGRIAAPQAALPLWGVTLGVALLLVGPVTWVGISLENGGGGTLPAAGPSPTVALVTGRFGGVPGSHFRGGFPGVFQPGGPRRGGFGGRIPGSGSLNAGSATPGLQVDNQLVTYLEAHQGSAKYLFATSSSQTAAPYIIATGRPVMALGGFSGSDQILTLAELQALIQEGRVRYFLLDGGGFGSFGGGSGNAQLVSWVESTCTSISASAYDGSGGGTLYAC